MVTCLNAIHKSLHDTNDKTYSCSRVCNFHCLETHLIVSFAIILHNERGYMSSLWKNIKDVDTHFQIKHIPSCYSYKHLFLAIKAFTAVMYEINGKMQKLWNLNFVQANHIFFQSTNVQELNPNLWLRMVSNLFASDPDIFTFYNVDIKWIMFLLSLSMFLK